MIKLNAQKFNLTENNINMKTNQIKSKSDYDEIMKQIEKLLQKSTNQGGSQSLTENEIKELQTLSIIAEKFEDQLSLMPIKVPTTLVEMIRFKMYELNIKQKQLANILEISEARISELLAGKRKINIELAKKLHKKLNIDAKFILEVA